MAMSSFLKRGIYEYRYCDKYTMYKSSLSLIRGILIFTAQSYASSPGSEKMVPKKQSDSVPGMEKGVTA